MSIISLWALIDSKARRTSKAKCDVVSFDVSVRSVEPNRVGVVFYGVPDDVFGRFAKRNRVVVHVAHCANDEPLEMFKLACTFKTLHHAIDVVEIFVQILDEKNFTVGVDVGRG